MRLRPADLAGAVDRSREVSFRERTPVADDAADPKPATGCADEELDWANQNRNSRSHFSCVLRNAVEVIIEFVVTFAWMRWW
jgi:hypothetical protein